MQIFRSLKQTSNILKSQVYTRLLYKQQFGFGTYEDFLLKVRNIGISAHIDSGKTTFTERLLYYGGKIRDIHEVKGTDNVGATMDFMELERERGITIQSAATHLSWRDYHINVIDTPGHVDFTIEVERALRVLDGAILIICAASGIQPQTLTVDKQMKRYNVPRLIFINKMDRMGANPWAAIEQARYRLKLNCAAVQIPIGKEEIFKGVVDLIEMKAYEFEGQKGETIKEVPIPEYLQKEAKEKRFELIEKLANVDSEIEDLFLNESDISIDILKSAIRRTTLGNTFVPVFMGSAYKNKGVQLAIDGVCDYLPAPTDRVNQAYEIIEGEEKEITILPDIRKPFVGLAFKLEENKFGQLTYMRVYQGKLKRGDYIYNMKLKKRNKISRMVKMHANQMEEINEVGPGDIFAIFGVECSSGDTFTEGDMNTHISLSTMFVPEPVMSLKIKPTKKEYNIRFQKALTKFQREDPTFQVAVEKESEEIIISGMGELHLQIYAERMRREFNVEVELGQPTVNYRETITERANFDYLHKKQSGGAGQYARVIGYVEPCSKDLTNFSNDFKNEVVGTSVPYEYITAVEKAYYDCLHKGPFTGYPVVNFRYSLTDGVTHVVDSSANAFAIATKYSFKQAFQNANPVILEPIMDVEVTVPNDCFNAAMSGLAKRKGVINHSETRGDLFIIQATVPLSQMFGYATEIRGFSAGQGEFSMEYKCHEPVAPNEVQDIIQKFKKKKIKDESED